MLGSRAIGEAPIAGLGGSFGAVPYLNVFIDTQLEIEGQNPQIQAGLSTTRRPGSLTFDYLTAFAKGPAVLDAESGDYLDHTWYVRTSGNIVYLARSNAAYDGYDPEVELFAFLGARITEISLTFAADGSIVVVAERGTGTLGAKQVWVYWFKPALASYTFELVDDGWSPRVILDDPANLGSADVHIAYFKDGSGLLTRRASENFTTIHTTPQTEYTDWWMETLAWNTVGNLVAIMSYKTGERYLLAKLEATIPLTWLPRGAESDASPATYPLPEPYERTYRVGGTKIVRDAVANPFNPHYWLFELGTVVWRVGYDAYQRPTYEISLVQPQVFNVALVDYWKPPVLVWRTNQDLAYGIVSIPDSNDDTLTASPGGIPG